tara:strand:- start:1703 stop:1936 length:234 start_codon:yes stop_codon:yes gene_type:complete
MKNKYRIPFFILGIVNVALVLVNLGLQNNIDKLKTEKSKVVKQFNDLRCEYELINNEIIRLEDENQILGSYVATVNP